MAKKILSYNNDGALGEIPKSGSNPAAYFETSNNSLYVANIAASSLTTSLGTGILYTDGTGKLQTVSTSSAASGQYLQWDNTTSTYKFADATGNATGNFVNGSDLSGALSSPQILNISNVNTGTLSAKYGGTGVTSFTSGGLVVKDGSDTLKFLLPDAGFSVLRSTGSYWYAGGAGQTAPTSSVQLFISPGTWTKPSGHQKALLAVVGGGGSGGGGSTTIAQGGGGGGSAGAVYINEESIANIPSLQIFIGTGGAATSGSQVGIAGGTSYVSSSIGFYREAIGGAGGGGSSAAAGGAAGVARAKTIFGKIYTSPDGAGGAGGTGGTGGAGGAKGADSIFSAGGGGGGGGSPAISSAGDGGVGGSGSLNTFISKAGTLGNNTGSLPNYSSLLGITELRFAAGGGGGGAIGSTAYSSSAGLYGSGGGGGGGTITAPIAGIRSGSAGGDGYVLIVSW